MTNDFYTTDEVREILDGTRYCVSRCYPESLTNPQRAVYETCKDDPDMVYTPSLILPTWDEYEGGDWVNGEWVSTDYEAYWSKWHVDQLRQRGLTWPTWVNQAMAGIVGLLIITAVVMVAQVL